MVLDYWCSVVGSQQCDSKQTQSGHVHNRSQTFM